MSDVDWKQLIEHIGFKKQIRKPFVFSELELKTLAIN
jgi:hypothetical protein